MFKIKSFALMLLSLVSLFLTSPVLAGGGLVEFNVEPPVHPKNPDTYLSPGEQFTIHATVYADNLRSTYCAGCYIKFKLQNPQDSDYLAQSDDKTDQNGKVDIKVISKISGERVLIVDEIKNNNGIKIGENYDLILFYKGNSFSTPTPTPQLPDGNPSVWLLRQELVAPYGRQVTIKYGWSVTDGNIHYNIYTKIIYKGDNDWQKTISADRGPSTTLSLRSDVDYKIRVDGCIDKVGTCASSDELNLPKLKPTNTVVQEQTKKFELQRPKSEVVKTSQETTNQITGEQTKEKVGSDSVDLQKKVAELQQKLEVSQQRQSVVEKQLSVIMSWIKSFLPFFK